MERMHRRWAAASLAVLLLGGVAGVRALSEPKNDFRFSILGDRTGGAAPQIYGRVWREVDLLHPDFVVNVGDTIEGTSDAAAQRQWNELRPLWQRYKHYPLYFTPGNHDIWSDFSRSIYEKETGRPTFYSFNYQDAHFTILDNSLANELTPGQYGFLIDDLEKNRGRSPKFVIFHRPYWIFLVRVENREFELHKIARKYGVDYVISGHGHQLVRMVLDGIVYMEIGSSGATIARGISQGQGFKEGWFYHHVWARVKGSKVNLTVKEIDGPMGEGRVFRSEDWDANGPKFDVRDPAITDKPET
jgi:predicted phosphodiesterase